MFDSKTALIIRAVEEGTGAEVSVEVETSGLQAGVAIWFRDLGRRNGPVATLVPRGLKRHQLSITFGSFCGELFDQIGRADDEAIQLARALVNSVPADCAIEFPNGQTSENWLIDGPSFELKFERKNIDERHKAEAVVDTCERIVVPVLAAIAELIGYDEISEQADEVASEMEGAILTFVVKRRERNPRNRLLCIRLHGYTCKVCNEDPRVRYGEAGAILEVHHLQPLGNLEAARPYSPATDLVPVCPSCHRAMHTRRPVPWGPDDIKTMLTVEHGRT